MFLVISTTVDRMEVDEDADTPIFGSSSEIFDGIPGIDVDTCDLSKWSVLAPLTIGKRQPCFVMNVNYSFLSNCRTILE